MGDRYQSDGIKILVSIMSLILLFYLIGQLVSGLVMFQLMLGLGKTSALAITALVLLFYVSLGGAHADIISDGIQEGWNDGHSRYCCDFDNRIRSWDR